MSSPAIFPLDLTGESTTNRVEEKYTITQMLGEQYFQFKFRHGPSFNNVKLIHVETGRELKPQIDYQLTYLFKEATNKYREESNGKEIYSACVILNKKLSGNITATLQYLEGYSVVLTPTGYRTRLVGLLSRLRLNTTVLLIFLMVYHQPHT